MFWMMGKSHARIAAAVAGLLLAAGLAVVALGERAPHRAHAQQAGAASIEREIAAGELRGIYLPAAEPGAPVMLIVPGSGLTDRDGNSRLGVAASTYRLLAEGLLERGVSTVRVDKRGMFSSKGAGDPNTVTIDVYANDYRAWIDAIRAETGAPCVWLAGHSEGALMVSAAAQGRSDVCGLVLISGAGRKMGDVLRAQLQANPANAPVLPQALAAIDSLESGRRVDVAGMHPGLVPLFALSVQDFLISMFVADPAALAASATAPILVLHGDTDLQTTVEDAQRLAAAPGARLVVLEGVNHVLKSAPPDRAANMATYADPDLPLADGVVDAIEGFIKGG